MTTVKNPNSMDNPEMPIQNKQRKERPEGPPLPNRESHAREGVKMVFHPLSPLPPPPT